mgnify:CR=1 FL=1
MDDVSLIARDSICFCSEQLDNDVDVFIYQLNKSHTLNIDDIAKSMPYTLKKKKCCGGGGHPNIEEED